MATKNGNGSHVNPPQVAWHKQHGPAHAVLIKNLRVLVLNDDDSWFAQGLEIDYSAEAESLEEVKKRFEEGLDRTMAAHLVTKGNINGVLQVAPQEYWDKYWTQAQGEKLTYTTGLVIVTQGAEPTTNKRVVVDLQYQHEPAELANA